MAFIRRVSEHQIIIHNSSLSWTISWALFVLLLVCPAIYCLGSASGSMAGGNAAIPSWVGAVLLILAGLSFCLLLPFTIVTTTIMDKQTDTFSQTHGILNCIPCSCLPSTSFALSIIERVQVEGVDEEFDSIVSDGHSVRGPRPSVDGGRSRASVGGGEAAAATAAAERAEDDDDEEEVEIDWCGREVRPKMQVIVHTKFESVPVTAITTGRASCIPCRADRMAAAEICKTLEDFLGLTYHDPNSSDSDTSSVHSFGHDDSHAGGARDRRAAAGDSDADAEGRDPAAGVGLPGRLGRRPQPGPSDVALGRVEEAMGSRTPPLPTNPGGRPYTRQVQARAIPPAAERPRPTEPEDWYRPGSQGGRVLTPVESFGPAGEDGPTDGSHTSGGGSGPGGPGGRRRRTEEEIAERKARKLAQRAGETDEERARRRAAKALRRAERGGGAAAAAPPQTPPPPPPST